jgi:hypothetical protein
MIGHFLAGTRLTEKGGTMLAASKCTVRTLSTFDHRKRDGAVVIHAARATLLGALAASFLCVGTASAQSDPKASKVGAWVLIEENDKCSMFPTYDDTASLWVSYDTTANVYLDITTDKIRLKEGDYRYTVVFADKDRNPESIYKDVSFHAAPPNEKGRTFLKGSFDPEILSDIKSSAYLVLLKGETIAEAFDLPNASAAIGKFKNCVEKIGKTQGSSRK